MNRVDVAIAGGGLVGASLACALRGTGARVAVVEAATPGAPEPPSFDERYTALAPTTRRFFAALGHWDGLAAAAAPIREIHVSDRGRFGFTRLRAHEEGLEALGWVVPNRALGAALLPALEDAALLFRPALLTEVLPEPVGITLGVAAEARTERIDAKLLVIADGARSATRDAVGIGLRERYYGQTAIATNVRPDRDLAGRAFERFTADGPLALLPIADGAAAVVWTVPDAAAADLLALPDGEFLARLQTVFGHRLGRLRAVGRRVAYPLAAITAGRFTAARTVVIGNAAHTLHPVAGQGFNLAVRDVAALAESIAAAIREGVDPGTPERLRAYAQARRADYRRTFAFTDGLIRIFSNRLPVLAPLRNGGLVVLDLFPGARRRVLQQAMGRGGRLPRLARGLPLGDSP